MTRIPIPPVTREPVEAKVFDAMWIRSLVVICDKPGDPGMIVIEWLPMAADGELLEPSRRIECNSLYGAMAEVPELANAFISILGTVYPLINWLALQEQNRIEEQERLTEEQAEEPANQNQQPEEST